MNLWQSRFLSSGSPGDGQWIVPLTLCCGSYDARHNFLLQAKSESLDMKEFIGCSFSQDSLMGTGCSGKSDNAACSWLKVNVDQTGFYRVKYDEDLAARLRFAIESNCLSPSNRFGNLKFTIILLSYQTQIILTPLFFMTGILDDSFALCMARQQSLTSLLTLMGAYREEVEYTVLSNLITVIYASIT